jgi:MoxR-like ATPase
VEARAKTAFVGRAAELGKLAHALEAAQAGSGATVLVAGEAGIGKTRLASEVAGRARDAGVDVLLGRSIDLVGTELPYQQFPRLVRRRAPPADGQVAGPAGSLKRSRC